MTASALLASLPVLAAAGVLLAGRGALMAAGAAVPVTAVLVLWRFPFPGEAAWPALLAYLPTLTEVLLILLFGMVLAGLLQASGAMRRMSAWILESSPSPGAGAALVVLGIVPFAESVTGFGIGVTVGVPILVHMGLGTARSALLGLSGLVIVPWGALGPGTTVAASLAGLGLDELGVATAWVNAVPVGVVALLTAVLASRGTGPRAALATTGYASLAALTLWGGVLVANLLIGTPIAGVVGSALSTAVLLTVFLLRGTRPRTDASLGRALLPYAVLSLGLLASQGLTALVPGILTRLLATPPVWLAVGVATAVLLTPRSGAAPGPTVLTGLRAWTPVGVTTGLFMMIGWTMTVTGMSAEIGAALARLGAGAAPVLSAIGGVLTGSNTGANAMFASTTAAVAQTTGTSVLALVAAANAASSISALAAPPRVAMAVALALSSAHDGAEADMPGSRSRLERAVLLRALGVVAAAVAGLAVVSVL